MSSRRFAAASCLVAVWVACACLGRSDAGEAPKAPAIKERDKVRVINAHIAPRGNNHPPLIGALRLPRPSCCARVLDFDGTLRLLGRSNRTQVSTPGLRMRSPCRPSPDPKAQTSTTGVVISGNGPHPFAGRLTIMAMHATPEHERRTSP